MARWKIGSTIRRMISNDCQAKETKSIGMEKKTIEDEKETLCDKSAPDSVFGGKFYLLKKRECNLWKGKSFMRLAWIPSSYG